MVGGQWDEFHGHCPTSRGQRISSSGLINDDQWFRGLEYLNHFEIALGSQGEVDVQLEIAFRLGYCERAEYERIQARFSRVGRMLNGLIASVRQRAGESQS